MIIQNLNGTWNYRIGKGKEREIEVPFSALPVGHSECSRMFDLEYHAERVFLRMEGITYAAKVYVNDFFLGEMGPYSEYRFEITDIVKAEGNIHNLERLLTGFEKQNFFRYFFSVKLYQTNQILQ